MVMLSKTVKYALDRFLENVDSGNDKQMMAFMKVCEAKSSKSLINMFKCIDVKTNPAIEMVEKERGLKKENCKFSSVSRRTLNRALEDYLDMASNKVKYKFVSQILEHYDLDVCEYSSDIIDPSVNYLRRQNFINKLNSADRNRNTAEMNYGSL